MPREIASKSAEPKDNVRRLPVRAGDEELARGAARGEPAAQAGVWDRYATLVRGLLRRSLGPGAEVEDQLQEVFIRFFDKVAGLRDARALRAFLIGIAMRVASEELRRRRVRRWLHLTPSGSVPESAGEALDEEAREALARLYSILDDQSDEARLAFVMRHVEGLELAEVAVGLGVSLATAKRRLADVTPRVLARIERDPVLAAYARGRVGNAAPEGGEP
jgi:RNA polymerase sigma-70 factor (ECF subfamily)